MNGLWDRRAHSTADAARFWKTAGVKGAKPLRMKAAATKPRRKSPKESHRGASDGGYSLQTINVETHLECLEKAWQGHDGHAFQESMAALRAVCAPRNTMAPSKREKKERVEGVALSPPRTTKSTLGAAHRTKAVSPKRATRQKSPPKTAKAGKADTKGTKASVNPAA